MDRLSLDEAHDIWGIVRGGFGRVSREAAVNSLAAAGFLDSD
jgi:hypothetical protein